MSHSNGLQGMMTDYTNLRTVPALLSVVFVIAGLYQFGGISQLEIVWANNYMLTSQHAMLGSLGAFVVAFASSETKDFDHYQKWEQVAIAAGPILIVAHTYSDTIANLVATESHLGPIAAFAVTVVSWGVAVQ